MDDNLDAMDRNLEKSGFLVRGMSSTFGFIRNMFTSTKKFEKPPPKVKAPP